MLFLSKVIAALYLLTAVLACRPNFQGNKLTIYRGTIFGLLEWRPISGHITLVSTPQGVAFAKGEFLVEFTGQPDDTYRIKAVGDQDRALTRMPATGVLQFQPIIWNGAIKHQHFKIDCTSCSLNPPNVASGCVIFHPASNRCVTGLGNGNTLHLSLCNNSPTQRYTVRAHPW